MKKEVKLSSVAFPAPVYIVGTYNEDGTANAMNAAWGGICASDPPSIMVAVRPARKTFENIMNNKAFTINFPNEALMEVSDYIGLISGKKENKIEKAGLKTAKGEEVNAPILTDYPVSLECSLTDKLEVGSHMLFIGEIKRVLADEEVLDENDRIDVGKVGAIGYDPAGRNYILTNKVVGKAFCAGLGMLKKKED